MIEGISVSSPSSRGSSSSLSDISGEEGDEVFWLLKPFHKVLRRRDPNVVVTFATFNSSSLRLLSSTAVCRMLSMPPADTKGYAWRRLMPSMKASLSSHALNGDGGPCSKFSSAQRLGACCVVFPRLEKSQEEQTSDRFVAYRKSGPLTRINILAQMSTSASSLGDEVRVVIEQANNESHTDKTDGKGSVCVSKGASHRLRKDGSADRQSVNQVHTRNSGEGLGQDPSDALGWNISMSLFMTLSVTPTKSADNSGSAHSSRPLKRRIHSLPPSSSSSSANSATIVSKSQNVSAST